MYSHWRDTLTYVHIPLGKYKFISSIKATMGSRQALVSERTYLHKNFNAIFTQKIYSYNPKYLSSLHNAQTFVPSPQINLCQHSCETM